MFQRLNHALSVPGALYGYSLLAVAGLHWFLGDLLIFYSDAYSLLVYFSVAALAPSLVVLLLLTPLMKATIGWKQHFYRVLLWPFPIIFGTLFLRLSIGLVTNRSIDPWATLICLAVMVLVVHRMDAEVRRIKTEILTRGVAWAGIVVLPLVIAFNWIAVSWGRGEGPPQHLVLIVLDGLPSQHIHTYNPQAPATRLDEILKEGQVFQQAYTSRPFTNSYFGILYTGKCRAVEAGRGVIPMRTKTALRYLDPAKKNLLATLQNNKVNVRWITFHRNAIPESCAEHIHNYRGLRSAFLTEHFTWIPEALKLDYHVASSASKQIRTCFGELVYNVLNIRKQKTSQNLLTEILLPQMRALQSRGERTCLIYHVNWKQAAAPMGLAQDSQRDSAQGQLQEQQQRDHFQAIRENEYRYDADLEWFAEEQRELAEKKQRQLGERIAEFMTELQRDPRCSDTTIVLTADHGSMHSKGRFWYAYHPNQEVVCVPLAIFNQGQAKQDQRLISTPDLTASILDFFEIRSELAASGRSIFKTNAGRPFVASLTRSSEIRKQWYLVVVKDGIKYQANLHPEGDGETTLLQVDGVAETLLTKSSGSPPQEASTLAKARESFGVEKKHVHPAFQKQLLAKQPEEAQPGITR